MSQRAHLAVAGAVTGVAGVVVSEAVASALRGDSGPVAAVAAAVRDLTPGSLAVWLVHLVGRLDKPLLLAGTGVILLGLCAYAATFAVRRPIVPDLVFLALAAVGMAAVLTRPSPGLPGVLAVVAGLLTWIAALRVLVTPVVAAGRPPSGDALRGDAPPVASPHGRRAFLVRSMAVLAAAGLAGVAGRAAGSGRRQVEQARRALSLPVSAGTAPTGAELGVTGVAPWRTPDQAFYVIHTALAPPVVTPEEWRLRIHGMVEKEVTVGFADLLGRGLVEDWVTLCCVSNEVGGDLVGNAFWSGVPVRDLLAQARPLPGADAVKQTSADGWTCGTPLVALTDPQRNAMLAVAMNGRPLPLEHGFPVRMVVPGLYGFVSATKWVVDLEVTTLGRVNAYWTQRGWSAKGPVKTQSRVDVPGDGADVKAGRVRVGGSAWAQHTGIEKVEYQLDGGPWQRAELGRVPDADTWVQWAGTVEVEPGEHRLYVRATDRTGYTQTSVRTGVLPDGATGWDSHTFTARARG